MTPFLRPLVLSAAMIGALAFTANAQTADNRYGQWAPPGSTQSEPVRGDARMDGLLNDLDKLVREAEAARAANPVFLKDLKDLSARYRNPWASRLLFDDFADGEFLRNPTWSVTAGDYFVEAGYGLRARATQAAAQSQPSQQMSKEQLAFSILGAVLSQGQNNGGQGGQAPAPAAPAKAAEAAVIETQAKISNGFSATLEFTSWKAEGRFELGVTQGLGGAGYRVAYLPGQQPRLELVKVTSRGSGAIAARAVTALEDQKIHSLLWTRKADGQMEVLIDGKPVLTGRDASFKDSFDGVSLSQQGTDLIIKSVDVLGVK